MVLAIVVGSRHYIGDGAYYTLAWVHYTLIQSMLTTVVDGAYWAPEHADDVSDWVVFNGPYSPHWPLARHTLEEAINIPNAGIGTVTFPH